MQIKNHWSSVFLGSLITDVVLPPDEPLSEKLCDNCKLCMLACPLGFMRRDESQTVALGRREFVCNLKHHHSCCGLSCGGFVGISQDGKWSSWATLRYKVPEDDKKLRDVWIRALNDPDAGYTKRQRFTLTRPERGILDRPQAATQPTCCNCLLVCSGPKEHRARLLKTLHSSGIVVRDKDGNERAVQPDTLDPLFTWELK